MEGSNKKRNIEQRRATLDDEKMMPLMTHCPPSWDSIYAWGNLNRDEHVCVWTTYTESGDRSKGDE